MRFSEAMGRKVVSTSTADSVGKIDDFVVDPRIPTVVALALKKTDSGDTLRWADITAFGADAVTVTGVERLTEADADVTDLLGKDHRLIGKRALATTGDEIGTVTDVEFDPSSGTVTAIVLDHDQIAGNRLVGVGSYAVVIRAEPSR
ncbi:MAG: PRC-barrel domain-containing protein [Jatrophihabitans sp.]